MYRLGLLLVLLSVVCLGKADSEYYMDTTQGCSSNAYQLTPGQKVTVYAKSRNSYSSSTSQTCLLTFKSPNGFKVDFDDGKITDCGVTLSLHSSSTATPSNVIDKYSCASYFPRYGRYFSSTYLTLKLTRDIQSAQYSGEYAFEVDITGRAVSQTGVYYSGLGNLTTGILVSIIISAILSLLCCILVPLGIWCCVKRRRRYRDRDIPVVYTTYPTEQATFEQGYGRSYGRPCHLKH